MDLEQVSWVFVILSLIGNAFVIQKNVMGQWLWTVSNFGWVVYDISFGAYSQACLFAAYFVMSVWGVYSWTRAEKKAKEA